MGEREGCLAGRATTQAILLLQPKMLMLRGIALCRVKIISSTLLDQGFPPALLQHLYIVGMLRDGELPQSTCWQQWRVVLFLWHCKQEKIAPLRPFYPESAGQHWTIQCWVCGREQRSPSSERSPWPNLPPSAPLTKSLLEDTSVSTESKWCKKRHCSLPCGLSQAWDASTGHGQRPGLGDS